MLRASGEVAPVRLVPVREPVTIATHSAIPTADTASRAYLLKSMPLSCGLSPPWNTPYTLEHSLPTPWNTHSLHLGTLTPYTLERSHLCGWTLESRENIESCQHLRPPLQVPHTSELHSTNVHH